MNALLDSLTEQLGEPAGVSVTTPPRILPDIINVSALLADEGMTPPPEIIEGIMAVGTKNVVAGSSKTNKTWLLLDLAIAVATGGIWMGLQALQGKVLYINLEILPPYLRKRLQALLGERVTEPLPGFDLLNLRGHPIELKVLCAEVIKKLKAGSYILVIIDPIYKLLLGLDENRAGDIGTVCFELERIAKESGAAVLYAHFSKGGQAGKESVDRISGSGVYGRDADTLITLTRHEVDNCYSVEFTLRNHPCRAPSVVEWAHPRMISRPDLDPAMLKTGGRRKIAVEPEAVLRLVPEGVGTHILLKEVLRLASRQGFAQQRTKDLLKQLVDDRHLFLWRIPVSTRPAIGYGRTPQPMPGGGVVLKKARVTKKGYAK